MNPEEELRYHIELTLPRAEVSNVLVTVVNSVGINLLNYNYIAYDIQHLRSNRQFSGLSSVQKSFLEEKFNNANPRKPVNYLTSDPENCIKIGDYNFINEPRLIF